MKRTNPYDWYNLPTRKLGERERVASGGGLDYFENESVITPDRLGELDLSPIRAALAETLETSDFTGAKDASMEQIKAAIPPHVVR